MKYILQIDSYEGETTQRYQHSDGDEITIGHLFAVIDITDDRAEIIDDGYRTREEAQEAWPEAFPQRIECTASTGECKCPSCWRD